MAREFAVKTCNLTYEGITDHLLMDHHKFDDRYKTYFTCISSGTAWIQINRIMLVIFTGTDLLSKVFGGVILCPS